MPLKLSVTLCALTLTIMALAAHAGEVVDRIVATVNGEIILQSDWEDAVQYEAFVAKRPLGRISFADREAALDHLIDQELLREQMRAPDSLQPAEQEVENQIKEIRKQYTDIHTDAEWTALLASHRLTESELRRRATLQLELTRLVDIHLRPEANISSKSIESYYRQELLPQLHQSSDTAVPLADVSPKIREVLTQQKISELLVAWLQDLRAASDIRMKDYSSQRETAQ
ncbi:MAG TPA: SurA N-terminal domain-containing protein [Terriglobales bacterium]